MMMSQSDRELLRHHGDVDAEPGLLDFAVNVRLDRPPPWLRDRLVTALDRLGQYPTASDDLVARTTVAQRHGRTAEEVLLLSGAAECFALLPTLRPNLAAVVHPSFTEPEFALRNAGVPVTRVQLDPADGFRLRPELVPEEADLVVVGNPTNPTSVLHSAETIRRLVRPGRVVVVDEAFADAVAGEPESLTGSHEPGLLVVRSLTKMWGLPGLRAGYALGDPELLARLGRLRPHWPLGTLALEAIAACCEPEAISEADRAAERIAEHRDSFAEGLAAVPGIGVTEPATAPFLLLRIPGAEAVRHELRERGIAVRRGDTFPGLGADHIRLAVREPQDNDVLIKAVREVLEMGASLENAYTQRGAAQ